MGDEFTERAAQLATQAVETELISATRDFEDAQRLGGEEGASLAADALKRYAHHKRDFDELTGANQPRQQSGQLSVAQRNFLSRRASLGDDLTPERMRDYALGHVRATNAGLEVDSAQYFAAVERSVDSMGDGRQKPLDEAEVASMCGISQQEYAAQAARLRAMKRNGSYGGDR